MNLKHPEELQEALKIAAKSDIEALRKELEALSMATKSYIEALVNLVRVITSLDVYECRALKNYWEEMCRGSCTA